MAETLKVTLLERHKLRQANLGRTKRVEQLYSYLASSTFSLHIRIVLGVRRKSWTGLCRKSEALPVFQGTE